VELKNVNGNAVSGKTVTLAAGSGSSTITTLSGITNASGVATFTVKDTVDEVVVYTAKDTTDSVVVTQTATVTFTPAITSLTPPTNGWYGLGGTLNFTVNYNTSVTVVTVTGTPYINLTFASGGTNHATYFSGTGTSALLFRYTVLSGDLDANGITVATSINLNGGSIKDAGGDNAPTTLPALNTTRVLVDGDLPTSSVSFPANAVSYNASGWNAGCASKICGAATDVGSGVASVGVSIKQNSSGNYWSSGSFSSATEVFNPAAVAAGWSYAFPASNLTDGTYTVRAVATDFAGNMSAI